MDNLIEILACGCIYMKMKRPSKDNSPLMVHGVPVPSYATVTYDDVINSYVMPYLKVSMWYKNS